MRDIPRTFSLLAAALVMLAGCVAGPPLPPGRHLTDVECRSLAAIRSNASPTMAEHQAELGALRKAGYDPSPFYEDPYYPEDLQQAQRLVDYWFQTECSPVSTQ